MTYGVIPTGFDRKHLPTILSEIESAMITEFGPKVIQTPQSPFGQINGLMADLISSLWEFAEDVYQSYDVDQAEGVRLDILAKLRLIQRTAGETDAEFRRAINNQDRARIDVQDISRAIQNVEGVTYSHVWVNDSAVIDPSTGLQGGSLAVAVLGGSDSDIAAVLRMYVVPGVSLYGNTYVSTIAEGYCRTLVLLRPTLAPVKLTVRVSLKSDAYGCPPPSVASIRDAIVNALSPGGSHELLNGDDITHFRIRSIVESLWPNVEVLSIYAEAEGHTPGPWLQIGFNELATLRVQDVIIEVATDVPTVMPPPDVGAMFR